MFKVLELPLHSEPDWEKAKSFLFRSISNTDAKSICEKIIPEENWEAEFAMRRVVSTYEWIFKCYQDGGENVSLILLSNSKILVLFSTNQSYHTDNFDLFVESGMAEQAGFI